MNLVDQMIKDAKSAIGNVSAIRFPVAKDEEKQESVMDDILASKAEQMPLFDQVDPIVIEDEDDEDLNEQYDDQDDQDDVDYDECDDDDDDVDYDEYDDTETESSNDDDVIIFNKN